MIPIIYHYGWTDHPFWRLYNNKFIKSLFFCIDICEEKNDNCHGGDDVHVAKRWGKSTEIIQEGRFFFLPQQ